MTLSEIIHTLRCKRSIMMKAHEKPQGLLVTNRPFIFGGEQAIVKHDGTSSLTTTTTTTIGWYYHVIDMIQNNLKEFMANVNVVNNSTSRLSNRRSFPAVDLASGSGAFVIAMAKHFQRPKFTIDFEWYPTEWNGTSKTDNAASDYDDDTDNSNIESDSDSSNNVTSVDASHSSNHHQRKGPLEYELRSTLRFLGKHPMPICADRNGKAIYRGDSIKLTNLQTTKYNHVHGIVIGHDTTTSPSTPANKNESDDRCTSTSNIVGRYGVQLGPDFQYKVCSFKSTNMIRDGNRMGDGILNVAKKEPKESTTVTTTNTTTTMMGDGNHICARYEKACQEEYAHQRKLFYDGLLQRSCEIDISNRKAWSTNLPSRVQQNQCVLVTWCCTTGTSQNPSYPRPNDNRNAFWQECLQLASQLLCVGGLFLTVDSPTYSQQHEEQSSGTTTTTTTTNEYSYGNISEMVKYIQSNSLNLALVESRKVDGNAHNHGDDNSTMNHSNNCPLLILLWRKVQTSVDDSRMTIVDE